MFHVSTVTDKILKEMGDNKKVNIQPDIVFLLINVFQVFWTKKSVGSNKVL